VKISRRCFLGSAAYLSGVYFRKETWMIARPVCSGSSGHSSGFASQAAARPAAGEGVLLEDFSCTLEESLEGYRAELQTAGLPFQLSSYGAANTPRLIIMPAAALTDVHQMRWLRNCIEQGATALVESGGAFLAPAEFRLQKYRMRSEFGVAALERVKLWENTGHSAGPAYVDFTWPLMARIRDFSHVVPLGICDAKPIAFQDGKTVAVMRRLGRGALIFLGSPVGPHLLAGDREAQAWFDSFLCHATQSEPRG
jgi:hypothetical protein